MITMTRMCILIPLLLATLVGCQSEARKTAEDHQSPANVQPKSQSCEAINDPAAAEDCRFREEVMRKRQRSNANPVVTHAPGTIKQP